MSRPGGKKAGKKSFSKTGSPRRMLDHQCPRLPADFVPFRTPDLAEGALGWSAYLRRVWALEPYRFGG